MTFFTLNIFLGLYFSRLFATILNILQIPNYLSDAEKKKHSFDFQTILFQTAYAVPELFFGAGWQILNNWLSVKLYNRISHVSLNWKICMFSEEPIQTCICSFERYSQNHNGTNLRPTPTYKLHTF